MNINQFDSATLLDKYFNTAFTAPNGIQKLRELILSLAMQGKLVPQDPNDQPASELLKEIEAEKQRLIQEGKIKKSKKLPEITPDEIPYDLPESWEWVRLGNCMLKVTDGTHHSPPNTETGDFLYISAKNIKDNGISLENVTYVEKEIHEKIYSRCDPEFGNILYIKDGATTGIVTINNLKEPFSILSSVALLKQPMQVYNYYLLSALKSPFFYSEMRAGMTGVAITRVTLKKLSEAIIPLPPLNEQRRIVEKIDSLMAQCDRLEQLRNEQDQKRLIIQVAAGDRLLKSQTEIEFQDAWKFIQTNFNQLYSVKENVSELRKVILQLAVMGKLVPQDPNDLPASELLKEIAAEKQRLIKEKKIKKSKKLPEITPDEIPYDLPESWEWVKVDELVLSLREDIRTGPFGSLLHKSDHRKQGVPVWGIESINKNGTFNGKNKIYVDSNKAEELASFSVSGGDIILSRSGTIGELCRLPNNVPYGFLSTNLMKISLDKKIISPDFFCLLFKGTQSINEQLTNFCAGSTRLFLTQSILSKLIFPLPPLPEQHRIVKKVDQLMALCDRLEEKIKQKTDKQTRLLDAIMAKVMSKK